MASKFEATLRELATTPDEDSRLEMAAQLDAEAAELDENWSNRDEFSEVEAERDRIAEERDNALLERDEIKQRYQDRFFDSGEGATDRQSIVDMHAADAKKESRPRGFAALWNDTEN